MAKTIPKIDLITLDGIDVTTYRYDGTVIKPWRQAVKYGTFKFNKKITDILTLDKTIIGKTFTWQRGFTTATERYIFRGEVVSYSPMGSFIELGVADKAYVLVRREQDYTYDQNTDPEAGIGSEIIKDLATIEDLQVTDASVPPTGSSPDVLIKTYPARGSRLESIQDLANTYVRIIYYRDSDDLLYCTPLTFETNSTVLTIGTNVVNKVRWENTGQDMVNNATLIGGEQLDWTTQTFTASAGQTTFTVDAVPVDTEVVKDSVSQNRGVDSSDPQDFYVKADSKDFIFTNAMTGGESIIIAYSYNIPAKVASQDASSITTYKQRDKTITSEKILNSDDAEVKVKGFLEESSQPLTSAPLRVIGDNTLEVGQLVTVIDNPNSINSSFLINGITYYSPYRPDSINVGKKPISDYDIQIAILNNLDRLNRQLASNSEVNVQIIQTPATTIFTGYNQIQTAPMDTDTLYWDSETQGTWGNSSGTTGFNWGTDTEETYTTQYLMPLNRTYYDDFYTLEFKDLINTTANWIGSGAVNFLAGQTAVSTFILKDTSTTYGYATLNATYTGTGTLTFQISLDGTNYETVVEDVEKTFTNRGNYAYWKATSTGTISLTQVIITIRSV